MIETLATIDAPHFFAGVVLRNDRVVEAANIVRYMRGWSRDRVRDYCRSKDWQVSVVYEQIFTTSRGTYSALEANRRANAARRRLKQP